MALPVDVEVASIWRGLGFGLRVSGFFRLSVFWVVRVFVVLIGVQDVGFVGVGFTGWILRFGLFLLSAPGAGVSLQSLGVEFMKVQGLSVSELSLKP